MTANPLRNEREIVLDDKTYNCRLTMDAIAKIEARYGPLMRFAEKIAMRDIGVTDAGVILGILFGKDGPSAPAIGEALLNGAYLPALEVMAGLVGDVLRPAEADEADEGNGVAAAT